MNGNAKASGPAPDNEGSLQLGSNYSKSDFPTLEASIQLYLTEM